MMPPFELPPLGVPALAPRERVAACGCFPVVWRPHPHQAPAAAAAMKVTLAPHVDCPSAGCLVGWATHCHIRVWNLGWMPGRQQKGCEGRCLPGATSCRGFSARTGVI
eukprot:366028-Chlamydomonas_euryale.AAC.9